jgi:hypothetical protein
MFIAHINLLPFPIDTKFSTLMVNHMRTRQHVHGMGGPMSSLQVEVGHHLHSSFTLMALNPKVMC